jgi:hypothetical protein
VRLLSVDASTTGRNRAALARLIASSGADAACVHNSPHLLRWRSISAALGRRSGLVLAGGGRLAGANLLLCTLGIDAPASGDIDLQGGNRIRPAGAVLGHLRVGGRDVVLAAATLIGNAAQRIEQADRLQNALSRFLPGDAPAVVSVQGAGRPGTGASEILARGRSVVAGRLFIDARIVAGQPDELAWARANTVMAPVVVELTV